MTKEAQFLAAMQGKSEWFASLADPIQAQLAAAAQVRRVKDGEAVYRQGDAPDGLYAMLQGRVRLIAWSPGGVGCLLLLAAEGMWFGEVSTIDAAPRQQDAIAQGACQVARIPLAAIAEIAAQQPELWRHIGRLACTHQRQAISHIQDLLSLPRAARVAKVLLASSAGDDAPVAMTQDELAGTCGMGRQTANAILGTLEQAGMVRLGYRVIWILDAERLARVAMSEICFTNKE